MHLDPVQQPQDWGAGGEGAHHVGDNDHREDYNKPLLFLISIY